MRNRQLKLKLHAIDPRCFWCEKVTFLERGPGQPKHALATIDHIYSKLNILRWVKAKPGETRRVLACYECNQKRHIMESSIIPIEEQHKRSQGFRLNPGLINEPLETLTEVVDILEKAGTLAPNEYGTQRSGVGNTEPAICCG